MANLNGKYKKWPRGRVDTLIMYFSLSIHQKALNMKNIMTLAVLFFMT